jgi:hypothetical protein
MPVASANGPRSNPPSRPVSAAARQPKRYAARMIPAYVA